MEKNYNEKELKLANDVSLLSSHIYTSLRLSLDTIDNIMSGLADSAKNPDEYPSIDSNSIVNIIRNYNVVRELLLKIYHDCSNIIK